MTQSEDIQTISASHTISTADEPLRLLQDHSITFIIPTLNEAKNLPYVLPHIPTWANEILLVDGYSTDDTVDVARRLRPDIRVIMQEGNGKGAALRTAFAAATGSIIVMLDGDGSTHPAEAIRFINALFAGADFAKGSRFLPGGGSTDMTLVRWVGNHVFTQLVCRFFGASCTDLCYGYNACWRSLLPQLLLDSDGFEIETLMTIRAVRYGFKVTEVPSFETKRIHGVSRLRVLHDGWRVLRTILREWLTPMTARTTESLQVEPLPVSTRLP